MTYSQALKSELKRAKEQLLSVRLLAAEMSDELQTVRHQIDAYMPRKSVAADALAALARIDSLLEPLHTAGKELS